MKYLFLCLFILLACRSTFASQSAPSFSHPIVWNALHNREHLYNFLSVGMDQDDRAYLKKLMKTLPEILPSLVIKGQGFRIDGSTIDWTIVANSEVALNGKVYHERGGVSLEKRSLDFASWYKRNFRVSAWNILFEEANAQDSGSELTEATLLVLKNFLSEIQKIKHLPCVVAQGIKRVTNPKTYDVKCQNEEPDLNQLKVHVIDDQDGVTDLTARYSGDKLTEIIADVLKVERLDFKLFPGNNDPLLMSEVVDQKPNEPPKTLALTNLDSNVKCAFDTSAKFLTALRAVCDDPAAIKMFRKAAEETFKQPAPPIPPASSSPTK